MTTFPSDIEIAQSTPIRHIREIAAKINIGEEDLEFYGKYKAKLPLSLQLSNPNGKLVLVTAMSPTKFGEGKTTTVISIVDSLNYIGKKAIAVLREPSLGPVFGVKGGAAGGGYSQVIPMEDINLHFTGDFSAIEKANNLLSAVIDNALFNKRSELNIDPRTILWKRVMDMNDRALRQIVIGLGGKNNGVVREEGFNITPASEIMAILCLANDLEDLKDKISNIYIGQTYEGKPIFARDLNVVGAMTALLKDAIKPNLVQTLEGNPAILHGGPFASIAQGTNSVIATRTGLSVADYVVTEAGFGADLGAEKFFHIKCQKSGLKPDAIVIVATIRALKHHGGIEKEKIQIPSPDLVRKGFCNLEKHIENILQFGIKPLVVINSFPTDSNEEIKIVEDLCGQMGVKALVSTSFRDGGKGSVEIAETIVNDIKKNDNKFHLLYEPKDTIEHKVKTITQKIYGAEVIEYSTKAKSQLLQMKKLGFDKYPICIAKTPMSFSDDEKKIGRPRGFTVTVREFEYASGAGFVIPLLGDVMRMPGLPPIPSAEKIDVSSEGLISGLF